MYPPYINNSQKAKVSIEPKDTRFGAIEETNI